MYHVLPPLTFAPEALQPFLGAETLEVHHGKHHRAYVDKLNALLEASELADLSLVELVRRSDGALFNNAGQHFNHSFYWRCIAPGSAPEPAGDLLATIERDFGSLSALGDAFRAAAAGHFGSGWCWLVLDEQGALSIRTTADAGCPETLGETPLLTCDVWEHAYYIDYRNRRPDYVDAFWRAVNWDFVNLAFTRPSGIEGEILGTVPPG